MEQFYLTGIDVTSLLNKIGQVIDEKLREHSVSSPNEENSKFISRFEVASLLKISLPTLNEWTKMGRLTSYKIGNRVLYVKEDVIASVRAVNSLKHTKGGKYGS